VKPRERTKAKTELEKKFCSPSSIFSFFLMTDDFLLRERTANLSMRLSA
jgi:hypothetical protein